MPARPLASPAASRCPAGEVVAQYKSLNRHPGPDWCLRVIEMRHFAYREAVCEAHVTDRHESLVLQAYVQMPLLPCQSDGSWVAALKTFAHCELRLVEKVAASPDQPVLRIELLDRQTRLAVIFQDCDELEDAVAAFQAMLPLAQSYAEVQLPPSDSNPSPR
jgi:hypothetical protein